MHENKLCTHKLRRPFLESYTRHKVGHSFRTVGSFCATSICLRLWPLKNWILARDMQSTPYKCSKATDAIRECRSTRKVIQHLTSQKKKINFAIRHFQKKNNNNLTIDPLSLGIYAPSPQVLTYRPQILRGIRI